MAALLRMAPKKTARQKKDKTQYSDFNQKLLQLLKVMQRLTQEYKLDAEYKTISSNRKLLEVLLTVKSASSTPANRAWSNHVQSNIMLGLSGDSAYFTTPTNAKDSNVEMQRVATTIFQKLTVATQTHRNAQHDLTCYWECTKSMLHALGKIKLYVADAPPSHSQSEAKQPLAQK